MSASDENSPQSCFEVGQSSGVGSSASSILHSESLPLYNDCGDCSYVCSHCRACFWYDERVPKRSRRSTPKYPQCCKSGSVVLPLPLQPPPLLRNLFQNTDFMGKIRAYNSMFAMTSFGARVDETVNQRQGPYIFKVSGQISHWIGSLCPPPSEPPRFLQLYFYDTEHEVSNRIRCFENAGDGGFLTDVVEGLIQMLDVCNEYVRIFRNARDMASLLQLEDFYVCLYNNVSVRTYDAPAPGSLGAILCGDDPNASDFDVLIHSKNGQPQRISKLHPSYMPLQYPLLFPFGEDGWSSKLQLRSSAERRRESLTINMFYSYQLHDRQGIYSLLLHGGRLFQQYLVDAYVCIEQSRLDFIRLHQDQLRSEYVSGIYDAISRGDSEGRSIGKRIFLPASFIGGPRYMYKHYQDALALCRVYGNPQYFITFTCNANWPEIRRFMDSGGFAVSQDRPDIIARVFRLKVSEFITFMKEDKTFGEVVAYLYTIEFQKRGLPHCHTLLWVGSESRISAPQDVDDMISAELPDARLHPQLYRTVTRCMIHGPCGLLNPSSCCMKNGKCSKLYPKPLLPFTTFDKNGYVQYKRRPGIYHTMSNGVQVDNGYVVPYNRRLSSRFDAHINVEYCGWNMTIKYLFKYISKGVDRVSFRIQRAESRDLTDDANISEPVNEITDFVDGRYICPHEAAWRTLNFSIHVRSPSVQVLAVHLQNMQAATFNDNSRLQSLVSNPSFGKTTLTGWLLNNRRVSDAHHLTYVEYCSLYRWDPRNKEWLPRSLSTVPSVGRLVYIHPTAGEAFYLRMLLTHQKGCRSFSEIRTVNEVVYPTFQRACEELGLIGDDKEWLAAFFDASGWASASQLRTLFCHLLLFCDVTRPDMLWEEVWQKMADDIVRDISGASTATTIDVDDHLLQQQILFELEKILNAATPSRSLSDFHLPLPSPENLAVLRNRLLLEEMSYDKDMLQKEHAEKVSCLNPDQLSVYTKVRSADSADQQILLFVYGHGGTGKTFLWSTILAYFRSVGKIVLAVAGSGIASLLLPSGRTAHSRFNIPLDLSNNSMCNIRKRTQLAGLLLQTSLVIWDEATMTDRACFECVDRSFRDIFDKPDIPFGGVSMLLGGDFRQTLPVKPKKSPSEIMASTLPNSYLWQYFTLCRLHMNMRLSNVSDDSASFSSWLLDIGNGLLGDPDPQATEHTKVVQIPSLLTIESDDNPLEQLIRFVYNSNVLNGPTANNLSNRAIVCPKNDTAEEINNYVLNLTDGMTKTYCSYDSVAPYTQRVSDFDILYPQEYLNALSFPGFPPHKLNLKKKRP